MPEENDNENEEGQEEEEEDPPSGPISGALPTVPDVFEMVGGCECGGISLHEICCPPKEPPGNSKDGSPASPGDPAPTGVCKLFETNISMLAGPHLGFALGFEPILDMPPAPPMPPIPTPDLALKLFGIPEIDVPAFPIPVPGLELDMSMPGMDIPGFFPDLPPAPDIPPFPGMPFLGITLAPIDFGIGLFKLDPKIPIPTADPCDLIKATGQPCPPIPGLPMLNIAICFLCLLCLLLMIIMPLLAILIGLGVVQIGADGKMLDENGEEVVMPPPLVIANPEDNRTIVDTFTNDSGKEITDPGVKVNEFDLGTEVTLIAKKYDLKKAFSQERFAVGPDDFSDNHEEVTRTNADGDEEQVTVRAGIAEGDENEDGTPGPEEPNMRYEWRIYTPEDLDETDVIAFVESMGFTTEDSAELNPDGSPVIPAGSFKPKTLDERTPIHTVVKTEAEHGPDARKLTFTFPKRAEYEVICFATKQAGSRPDLETQRLQSIIRVGAVDPDGVWRTRQKITELPEVLKEMRMPEHLSHIKRTPYPLEPQLPSVTKIPAPTPEVSIPIPQPPRPTLPVPITQPGKKDEEGV